MKNNNSRITDEVLVKYLVGEASEAEQQEVQQWIAESSENKNYYNDLRLIWNQSKNLAVSSSFDEDAAWQRFIGRTAESSVTGKAVRRAPSYKWLKIAAIFLLLAGGGSLLYFLSGQNNTPVIVKSETSSPAPVNNVPAAINENNPPPVADTPLQTNTAEKKIAAIPAPEKIRSAAEPAKQLRPKALAAGKSKSPGRDRLEPAKTKEFICNSTPCPIEICIVQTIKCQDNKTAQISTCSIVEPDQSGQLHYKAPGKIGKNCALNVEQITIKRLSTGETIVLTADSEPATAQDVFNYITGQKKGDIIAGVFHTDCNNISVEHGLRLDNNFGDLRMQ